MFTLMPRPVSSRIAGMPSCVAGTLTIRRGLIDSGELARLIAEDGLRGITSNPSIWEKAIAGSTDYDDAIEALRREGEGDPKAVYEQLAIQDIRDAADAFRPATSRRTGATGSSRSRCRLTSPTTRRERSPRRSGCGARSNATT